MVAVRSGEQDFGVQVSKALLWISETLVQEPRASWPGNYTRRMPKDVLHSDLTALFRHRRERST